MTDLPVPTSPPLSEVAVLTPEDLSRSHDRMRVLQARQTDQRPKLMWLLTGPGILVMLGENDGPSMLSSVSIVKARTRLAESVPACESKRIDDHLFSLLRRIIVGVIKPQQRGKRINICRFELVCEFLRIH